MRCRSSPKRCTEARRRAISASVHLALRDADSQRPGRPLRAPRPPGTPAHPAGEESATGCSCIVSSPSLVKAAPAAEKISPTCGRERRSGGGAGALHAFRGALAPVSGYLGGGGGHGGGSLYGAPARMRRSSGPLLPEALWCEASRGGSPAERRGPAAGRPTDPLNSAGGGPGPRLFPPSPLQQRAILPGSPPPAPPPSQETLAPAAPLPTPKEPVPPFGKKSKEARSNMVYCTNDSFGPRQWEGGMLSGQGPSDPSPRRRHEVGRPGQGGGGSFQLLGRDRTKAALRSRRNRRPLAQTWLTLAWAGC